MNQNTSSYELNIYNWLKSLDINVIRSDRKIIYPKELDLYLPEHNFAIEFNGLYWHSELKIKDRNYHFNKTLKCHEKNIDLYHIFEHEWLNKSDIIKSMILKKIRIFTNYVKTTDVRKISNDEYIDFIKENDLFDYKNTEYMFGLYSNYLVAVCGFIHLGNNIYKVCNRCSKKDIYVEDWFNIIVDYFIKKYKPYSLICNVDLRYFDLNIFNKWKKISRIYPKFWFLTKDKKSVISRDKYNQICLSKILKNYDFSLSIVRNMIDNGYTRIWDCGYIKMIL